jgi:hypothetical protein
MMVVHTKRKLHLNSMKTSETNIEKEWEQWQDLLKSAAYENLGKVKRQKKENI